MNTLYDLIIMSCLYHYTSLEAFYNMLEHSIIENEDPQKRSLAFWATHSCALNDTSERELYLGELINRVKRHAINKGTMLDPQIESRFKKMQLDDFYVISFSDPQLVDSLDMWRGYGGNGVGICLEIDFSQLSSPNQIIDINYFRMIREFVTRACLYQDPDKIEIDEKLIEDAYACLIDLNESSDLYSVLKKVSLITRIADEAIYYKHPAYESEKEWRIVTNSNGKKVHFYKKGNLIKPYVKFPIPLSAITSIMIGPCVKDSAEIESLERMIRRKIRPNIDIRYSEIPYRG